ncbi:MAG: hypothetical protein WC841_05630 [Candidatus Shapirobacteria bacterium]|jgi:hypothetical protein
MSDIETGRLPGVEETIAALAARSSGQKLTQPQIAILRTVDAFTAASRPNARRAFPSGIYTPKPPESDPQG